MKTMINYKENKLAFINARLLDPKSGIAFFDRILSNYLIKDYYLNQSLVFENLILDKSIVLASYAIYDNLNDWVVFDDYFFFSK